jgi:TRAP-type C4-dicarboxylate transport system substrate-binding protein
MDIMSSRIETILGRPTRRRALAAFLLGGFGLCWATASTMAAAGKPAVELKIATLAPDGSTWMQVMDAMDAEVRQATAGGVGFKFYANGAQGDENVVLRRMRNGQLHGAGLSGTGLGDIAPAVRVLELPFLLRGDSEVDAVHGAIDAELTRAFDEKGFVLLGWAEVGPVYVFTNSPVRSPTDLAKVKMWLWEGDPVAESLFKVFSIPPVPLSIAHVMTSLQTGMVDGVYSSPYGCVALQWFTRVKYITDEPMAHATGALIVSKAAFEKIPADQREVVKAIARRHLDGLVTITRKENLDALAAIEKNGIQRVAPDAAQLASLRERAKLVWKDLSGKLYPPELLDQVTKTLDTYRSAQGSLVE